MESVFDNLQLIQELDKPLDPERVAVLPGGIRYLANHDVIRRANSLFGYGNWGYHITEGPRKVDEGKSANSVYEVYAARVLLEVRGGLPVEEEGTCVRSGAGYQGFEMAWKGAVSDAVKRCLKTYGDQFGLVLYDKETSPEHELIVEAANLLRELAEGGIDRFTDDERAFLKAMQGAVRAGDMPVEELDRLRDMARRFREAPARPAATVAPQAGPEPTDAIAAIHAAVESMRPDIPATPVHKDEPAEGPMPLDDASKETLKQLLARCGNGAAQMEWLKKSGFGSLVQETDGRKALALSKLTPGLYGKLIEKLRAVKEAA